MNFKNLTIGKKMFLLAAAIIVPIMVQEAMSYRETQNLSDKLNDLGQVQIVAAREMAMVDMYHDSLRAVVCRAIIAVQTKDEKAKSEIAGGLTEYTGEMKSRMNIIGNLSLPQETAENNLKI